MRVGNTISYSLYYLSAGFREWIAMNAFRAARLEADLGYVEYKLLAQHRESWVSLYVVLSDCSNNKIFRYSDALIHIML